MPKLAASGLARRNRGAVISSLRQSDGAAFFRAVRNTPLNVLDMAVEVRTAWLPSMAPAGVNRRRTVFHLPSCVDGK